MASSSPAFFAITASPPRGSSTTVSSESPPFPPDAFSSKASEAPPPSVVFAALLAPPAQPTITLVPPTHDNPFFNSRPLALFILISPPYSSYGLCILRYQKGILSVKIFRPPRWVGFRHRAG